MALYRTDEEIAPLVGVGIDKWRALVLVWERTGFPKRDPQVKNKRYWPACRACLDRRNGLSSGITTGATGPLAPDGDENSP